MSINPNHWIKKTTQLDLKSMPKKTASVMRYAHRFVRDARVSMHCALVARAFGANEFIVCGEKDEKFEKDFESIQSRWGPFTKMEWASNWKKALKEKKKQGFCIVHLTMYGIQIQKAKARIRKEKKVLAIIGSEKVPREVYELSDYNVAIGNQPHSEIAALAVFLHEYFEGKELNAKKSGKLRIVPQSRGKKVVRQ